jgi:hypothetical protein
VIPDFDDFEDHGAKQFREEHYEHTEIIEYSGTLDCDDYEIIEPSYDLEYASPSFVKKAFYGLRGRGNFPDFDDKDDKTSLYHPNNQTIYDPYDFPDTPICPDAFLAKVTAELTSMGVFISNESPELLKSMCRTFNFSMNHDPTKLPPTLRHLVFPAQTGIGKSVSLQVYVSMLVEQSSLIVVAKVDEAISYCQKINQLSGNPNYARCYYAITDINKAHPLRLDAAELYSAQCLVITHNMFKRVNGLENTDLFSLYQGQPRDLIVIDEKLSFYEQKQLTYAQLDTFIDRVETSVRESSKLNALPSSHVTVDVLKKLKAFLLYKDDKIVTNDTSLVIKDPQRHDLAAELALLGETLTYSDDGLGEVKKLIDLKNKQAVRQHLHKRGYPTQGRKRNVIGVSSVDLEKYIGQCYDAIDTFFCEHLDPNLAACHPEPTLDCETSVNGDESFDYLFSDEYHKKFDEWYQASVDFNNKYHYLTSLSLAIQISKIILQTRVDELFNGLINLGAKQNPSYKQSLLNSINEQIETLSTLSNEDFFIYKTNLGNSIFTIEGMTNKLGLSVVLDATAQFNEYYRLANRFLGHVGFVVARRIRNYHNLTIYKAKGFNQSRAALYRGQEKDEIKENAQAYLNLAVGVLDKDDKLLIICHKDFKTYIEKRNSDSRIVFTHWGNHVGRNDWSDCNKVMLVGWNYLNPSEQIASICSALESVFVTTQYLDDELVEKFEVSQLADDMVQGFMRSQARVIATADSDCKSTSFYLFYKDDEKSHQVIDLVEKQFPYATVVDWQPKAKRTFKKSKKQTSADRVLDLLVEKAKSNQTYLLSELVEETGINKSTMNRLVTSDYFKQKLAELGFVYTNKDGRSNQFILN